MESEDLASSDPTRVPAAMSSASLSGSARSGEVTEFVTGREQATRVVLEQVHSAREELVGIGSKDAPNLIVKFKPYSEALAEAATRLKTQGRYITDISESNLEACKFLIEVLHVNVRHVDEIKSNLVITEKEFTSDLSVPHPDRPTPKLLYSNSRELIAQQRQLFETLWAISIPAEQRIREIREGRSIEETKLITHYDEVLVIRDGLFRSSKAEVLILLPALERMEFNLEAYRNLAERAAKEKIRVRVLAPRPSDPKLEQRIVQLFRNFEIRQSEPIQIGLFISDRKTMLFMQYLDFQSNEPGKAIASGIYSTHRETIASIVSIFETMWASSKVREREAKSRKQAELLQDLLTHDVKNYNQIARLSAEILSEELKDNVPVQSLVESMLSAIDGSTLLLNRAKKLGKALSDENPALVPIALQDVIHNALFLIKRSNPDTVISVSENYPGNDTSSSTSSSIIVLADELLGDVFANIFSNCVNYSEPGEVVIEIDVEEVKQGDLSLIETQGPSSTLKSYWIVSISDHGKGVPDELKRSLFSRYLEGAKGSGLGMSIVHALVVERFKGAVQVQDRVQGDYTKGTTVKIWLPKA